MVATPVALVCRQCTVNSKIMPPKGKILSGVVVLATIIGIAILVAILVSNRLRSDAGAPYATVTGTRAALVEPTGTKVGTGTGTEASLTNSQVATGTGTESADDEISCQAVGASCASLDDCCI